ncbi:hypothetical protein B0T11DRAFT_59960 [Plectosphaerella cucumerina]|uniref:Uncharacterized protein n=1 Tax=Plectosphaerella cucumerina TaxID=40658 RepID=A0A8K0TRQ4_9PEZI|nr:hypothetical protein B0T11DRAFT_59960 [Plectosphaerella cucumerina]
MTSFPIDQTERPPSRRHGEGGGPAGMVSFSDLHARSRRHAQAHVPSPRRVESGAQNWKIHRQLPLAGYKELFRPARRGTRHVGAKRFCLQSGSISLACFYPPSTASGGCANVNLPTEPGTCSSRDHRLFPKDIGPGSCFWQATNKYPLIAKDFSDGGAAASVCPSPHETPEAKRCDDAATRPSPSLKSRPLALAWRRSSESVQMEHVARPEPQLPSSQSDLQQP